MSGFLPMISTVTAADVATAVRSELSAELANLDEAVSTRLPTASYTAAADVAAAILAAATITPIHANVQKMNDVDVVGTGVESNKWRGA